MAREQMVTRGLVLRETVTKESDKILTLLTEERGKTPVIAKGARKKNSRYAACAQPLVYGEWTLVQRGAWYYAREGNTLELLALGSYFAELTEAAAVEEQPAGDLLRHLLNGLYALSALGKPPELVKAAFELKLLCLSGYEPLLDGCAYCGREDPAEPMLDAAQGVLHCKGCGPAGRSMALCADSLTAARRVVYGDARRLYGFRLGAAPLARLGRASEAFLLTQFDRRFQTLTFYKSLCMTERPPETAARVEVTDSAGRVETRTEESNSAEQAEVRTEEDEGEP